MIMCEKYFFDAVYPWDEPCVSAMIVVKDLKSERNAKNVMTQKFKNNLMQLTQLENDKETDKSLFDIDVVYHKHSGRRLLSC